MKVAFMSYNPIEDPGAPLILGRGLGPAMGSAANSTATSTRGEHTSNGYPEVGFVRIRVLLLTRGRKVAKAVLRAKNRGPSRGMDRGR